MYYVEEEVGFRPKSLTSLGMIYTTPGFSNEQIWLYLGRDLQASTQSLDDDEVIDVELLPLAEALAQARNGETVVALVGGDSATVKKMYREPDGRIRLQPANPSMTPIVEDARNVRIQGVVVGVIRKY